MCEHLRETSVIVDKNGKVEMDEIGTIRKCPEQRHVIPARRGFVREDVKAQGRNGQSEAHPDGVDHPKLREIKSRFRREQSSREQYCKRNERVCELRERDIARLH